MCVCFLRQKERLFILIGIIVVYQGEFCNGDWLNCCLLYELQGVSKGKVVEDLISIMRSKGKSPDFLLCIGDDRSDEDMFESIARSASNPALPTIPKVFACTVGQKPSMAEYYLDDTSEVMKLLEGLATASAPSASIASQEL